MHSGSKLPVLLSYLSPLSRKVEPPGQVEQGGSLIIKSCMLWKSGSKKDTRGQLKRNLRQAELIFPTLEISQNTSANVPGMGVGDWQKDLDLCVSAKKNHVSPVEVPVVGGLGLASLCEECHPLKLMTPIVASLHRNLRFHSELWPLTLPCVPEDVLQHSTCLFKQSPQWLPSA